MNKNIENFLNEYMINPDPQYAVFLKGNWGCGKTFFVNNWLNSYKKKIPEEQILKPVMVSLYGLSEIKQITAAINKALYLAKTEHSHPLGMVVSTHFRCGKGVKRGLKNGALPFNID